VRIWFSSNPLCIFYPIPNSAKQADFSEHQKLATATAQIATAEDPDTFIVASETGYQLLRAICRVIVERAR